MKSRGRPTLLPETLTKKTIDTISTLRLRGVPLTSSVINAVAKGIVQANDRTLLVENGGHLSLSNDCARKVLYRMDTLGRKMTRCIATTARIPVAPALLSDAKLEFQRKIRQLQSWHSIPDDLIINFDQTPFTPYHWSNKEKSKQLLDNVIFPYLKKRRHDLGLTGDQKSLLIYNVFTVQTTENIKKYIEENDRQSVCVK